MAVIKHFKIFKNLLLGFCPGQVTPVMGEFGFEGIKKALCGGIIVAEAPTAHATYKAIILKSLLVELGRLLTATITMHNQPGDRPGLPDGHHQRIMGKLSVDPR